MYKFFYKILSRKLPIEKAEKSKMPPTGKHSDTRIKPLPLTNGHGRYTRTGAFVRWEMAVTYITTAVNL
jgi:hypothetical protein